MRPKHAGRTGVFGASGSGKSTYVYGVIRKLPRVLVVDPTGDYAATLRMTRCETVNAVLAELVRTKLKSFRICYVPPAAHEMRALNQISALVMKAQEPYRNNPNAAEMTLVVEEMADAFPSGRVSKVPNFAKIMAQGRHLGINVIGVTQRVNEVATRFRGNCDETVVFRQQGPVDMKAAAAQLNGDIAAVRRLRNFEYLRGSQGEISFHKLKKPT